MEPNTYSSRDLAGRADWLAVLAAVEDGLATPTQRRQPTAA
jgi:hypothetical protein